MDSITTTRSYLLKENIKFREGKKWKKRICFIQKSTFMQDRSSINGLVKCPSLRIELYKKDKSKSGSREQPISDNSNNNNNNNNHQSHSHLILKSSFELNSNNYYGIRFYSNKFSLNSPNILSLLCKSNIHMFCLPSSESFMKWYRTISDSLGPVYDFKAHLSNGGQLPAQNVIVYLRESHVCLSNTKSSSSFKILKTWNIDEISKFGCIEENKFIFEISSDKRISAMSNNNNKNNNSNINNSNDSYVLQTEASHEIDNCIKGIIKELARKSRKRIDDGPSVSRKQSQINSMPVPTSKLFIVEEDELTLHNNSESSTESIHLKGIEEDIYENKPPLAISKSKSIRDSPTKSVLRNKLVKDDNKQMAFTSLDSIDSFKETHRNQHARSKLSFQTNKTNSTFSLLSCSDRESSMTINNLVISEKDVMFNSNLSKANNNLFKSSCKSDSLNSALSIVEQAENAYRKSNIERQFSQDSIEVNNNYEAKFPPLPYPNERNMYKFPPEILNQNTNLNRSQKLATSTEDLTNNRIYDAPIVVNRRNTNIENNNPSPKVKRSSSRILNYIKRFSVSLKSLTDDNKSDGTKSPKDVDEQVPRKSFIKNNQSNQKSNKSSVSFYLKRNKFNHQHERDDSPISYIRNRSLETKLDNDTSKCLNCKRSISLSPESSTPDYPYYYNYNRAQTPNFAMTATASTSKQSVTSVQNGIPPTDNSRKPRRFTSQYTKSDFSPKRSNSILNRFLEFSLRRNSRSNIKSDKLNIDSLPNVDENYQHCFPSSKVTNDSNLAQPNKHDNIRTDLKSHSETDQYSNLCKHCYQISQINKRKYSYQETGNYFYTSSSLSSCSSSSAVTYANIEKIVPKWPPSYSSDYNDDQFDTNNNNKIKDTDYSQINLKASKALLEAAKEHQITRDLQNQAILIT